MNYHYQILSSKYSLPSCRILRDAVKEKIGKRFPIYINEKLVKNPIIRFGNSFGDFEKDTEYNSPEFIRLCSSKLNFSKILKENGFYVPSFNKGSKDLIFPLLVRTSLFLSGGKGIILCENEDEFYQNYSDNYFWTPYVSTSFELRVHILGGNVIKIFRKELETSEKYPIRNNHSCHFSIRDINNYPKLNENVIQPLAELLGRDNFYALDIGWDNMNKKYFIFEANSAPGLNENTASDYADFLINKLELEV